MRLEADLHIHTVASGHAFSTVSEIVKVAKLKGLKAVALTDHGPALPGGAHPYHFWNQRILPETLEGVRVFKGAEANIVNLKGDLDLNSEILETLDLCWIAFHRDCGYEGKNLKENTTTLLKAMENPLVFGVAHPGNPKFPVDVKELVRVAKELNLSLEINNSSFLESTSRKGSFKNDLRIAEAAFEVGLEVAINSDAHYKEGVAEFDEAIKVAEMAGFTEEKVLNTSLKKVLDFLKLRKKFRGFLEGSPK